jgi:MoxR-like ATPase
MQEGRVSVEGETHVVGPPFLVIATENPIEYEGTYPLPEAQLDRFVLRAGVGYPERDEEWEILRRRLERQTDEIELERVVDGPGLLAMQASLERVHVDESIGRYIVDLVAATRTHADVSVGASPRGALALLKLARGRAMLEARDYVVPEDVKAVAVPALAHRLVLRPELWVRQIRDADIVRRLLDVVPTPSALDQAGEDPAGAAQPIGPGS